MYKLTAPLLALCCLAVPTAASAQWHKVTESLLGYSAAFPVKPKARAAMYQGTPQSVNSAAATGVFCNVSVSHLAEVVSPENELAEARDTFLRDTGAKTSSAKTVAVPRGAGTVPGLEVEATNAVFAMRALIVVDGAKVYQVAGGVPGHGGRKSDLERCVRGFQLLAD